MDEATGQSYFPKDYIVIETVSFTAKLLCSNSSDKNIPSKLSCPEPLVYDPELKYCASPCPAPVYSRFEISVYNIVVGILGSISTLGCGKSCYSILLEAFVQKLKPTYPGIVVVGLTYGLNPRLRRMPGVIVFWLALWVMLYNISLGSLGISCVITFQD